MSLVKVVGLAGLTFGLLCHAAWAGRFAANCRYDLDTPDRVDSYYGALSGNIVRTIPGQHRHERIRLDVDTGKGTVEESGDETDSWHSGRTSKSDYDGSLLKAFVVSDGRFVWFGDDVFNSDGSFHNTAKNRLDLESGQLIDFMDKHWECQKAVNQFE